MLKPASHVASGRDWWRAAYWGFAAVVLSAAFIGTRVSEAVRWTGFDFAFAAVMFGVTGLALEIALRRIERPGLRAVVSLSIFVLLALIWGALALQD